MRRIQKLAIANRGEIALRIIRACQDMGIQSVLLHSEVDVNTMAYRVADHRVCIGPPFVLESYLNIENVIHGALSAEADAIHPGFGFLSENADFAKACVENNLIFVGPSAESIKLFGDKISAKKLVQEVGAPTISGDFGASQSLESLCLAAQKIGYPVMVKAAGGGGGRGLKVIHKSDEIGEAIESARRECLNAFGSEQVFLEKYLTHAKHVEFQIFGEPGGRIYNLWDRECSIQRRHQKIIEEATSCLVGFELKEKMVQTAVNIAKKAQYVGAGTVEFLVEDGKFYFLEMNTRLQVEHPVTEFILGVDLVKAQILVAQGQSPMWHQEELLPRGHAIECRIYAEDPYKNGLPSTGVLGGCHWPHGPGRRFEVGFEAKDEITAYYDSMIAKVVVWGETRVRAIRQMMRTLEDTVIFGLKTNIPYLQRILSHPDFVSGEMTTGFIQENFPQGLEGEEISSSDKEVAEILNQKMGESSGEESSGEESSKEPWNASIKPWNFSNSNPWMSPWAGHGDGGNNSGCGKSGDNESHGVHKGEVNNRGNHS